MTGREITQRRRSLADANLNLVCGWALSFVVQTDRQWQRIRGEEKSVRVNRDTRGMPALGCKLDLKRLPGINVQLGREGLTLCILV